ncbi:MAG: GerAB/ArcD/ProY family transporter [Candidatus Njordarchaeia archaeon]
MQGSIVIWLIEKYLSEGLVKMRGNISTKTRLLLAIYTTGIIVGGGILALPFVALDSGLIFLVLLMVALAFIFNIIYWRILESVSVSNMGEKEGSELGLIAYDKSLEASGLLKWGKLTFTISIFLYVYPADIVYILYGMKSIIDLSRFVASELYLLLGTDIILAILLIAIFQSYRIKLSYLLALETKLLAMSIIWVTTLIIVSLTNFNIVITSALGFAISLIVGEYFPERIYSGSDKHIVAENHEKVEILPRHKAQSILTIFKLVLIVSVPIIALFLIISTAGINFTAPIWPRSYVSLVDSFSVLVFMYVGSGVYNILIYPWILKDIKEGKKIVSLGVIISLLVYMIFTLIILSIVDYNILLQSDINREHAFIALSRKLEAIGLSFVAYIVIGLAALFALVSVSVAYIGFTDTLSERLEIDTGVKRDYTWLILTVIVLVSTVLLEFFNVSRIATDALGIAGNAGGGLFLLTLPWLLNTKKDDGYRSVAFVFLSIITAVNILMFLSDTTIVAKVSAIVATVLVVVFGLLSIIEKHKSSSARSVS